MRKSVVFSSAALAVSLLALPVMAQDMDDTIAASQNQLGLLEYCEAQGHIDGTAVATQVKLMAMLPAPTDTAKTEAAYAKGKEGTVSAMGVEQTLTAAATAQNTDVKALCGQLASLVEQAAAQMPK